MQVTKNMDYTDKNCFIEDKLLIVSAKTFLSQLV